MPLNPGGSVVIGGASRLATAYMRAHPETQFIQVGRREIHAWLESDRMPKQISIFLNELEHWPENILVFAAVTDNSKNRNEMQRVNFDLPQGILEAAAGTTTKVTTFGSVLENGYAPSSRYLESKLRLSQLVEGYSRDGASVSHIRFHTLYGEGSPSPHMFLGQALNAIASGANFSMSSGAQYRQYVHVEDTLPAIDLILNDNSKAIYEISSSETFPLREIAESIFNHFGMRHLLQIGAIEASEFEPFAPDYQIDPLISSVTFRPTLLGINEYFEALLGRRDTERIPKIEDTSSTGAQT
jgi:nucleoside-diphosphate-sugar epimerase